jgi:UDP-N-acetylmuramoyl-L-alanyl-D-glutamate--2,6-diaminopimelate ligase
MPRPQPKKRAPGFVNTIRAMSRWKPPVPVTVSLRRLLVGASFVGCGDIVTRHATDRSRDCEANTTFAVIRGTRQDGETYIAEAIARGASALLTDHPLPDAPLPQCIVPDVRRAYAELCSALMGHPHRHMALAGVTGTNGKTTTTWLIRSILQTAGHQTGVLGTIEYHDGVQGQSASLTTPDSQTFNRWLATMSSAGTTHAAMELSSHALDQRRTAGTLLDAAVVTNITQDHFDYHGTFDAYRRSKQRIFDLLKPAGMAVLNADDPGSRSCLDDAPKRVCTFGLDEGADIAGTILEETLEGTRFRIQLGTREWEARTHLVGRHNVSNCLAAAAVAAHLDVSPADIILGLESLTAVPGRVEAVHCGQPFSVFVDFAHTDDALRRCLTCLRQLTHGRVICVFGAGGDRDKTKRPLMGRAVAETADIAVVTSDNPRTEDTHSIVQEILAGCKGEARVHTEIDRRRAIEWALQAARPGDAVLIAGKGHETEQIIGTERHTFDDRQVAREFLAETRSRMPAPHRLAATGVV